MQFLDDVRLKPHRTIIDETNEQTGDQTCGQAQVEDEFALGQTSSDGKETATQTCLQAGEQHLKDGKERAQTLRILGQGWRHDAGSRGNNLCGVAGTGGWSVFVSFRGRFCG